MINLIYVGHAYVSTLRLAEGPTNFSSLVRNGFVHLPTAPGLRVEADHENVRRILVASDSLRTPA